MRTTHASGPSARSRRLGAACGGLLFFVTLVGPGELDLAQRGALATTLLTATLWLTSALPLGAASLVPAALFPLFGVLPAREVASAYMHDLVLLFLGAFILSLGIERWGLHRRLALAVIGRVGASPRRVILGFMVASALLSMWISNTATTLVMLPIAVAVARTLEPDAEESRETRFSVALFLGIAYAASIGGVGTLVGTASNMAFRSIMEERYPAAPEVSFGVWMRDWLPLVALFVPLAWWLLTRFLSPVNAEVDARPAARRAVERARSGLGGWTTAQRIMLAVFALTATAWMTRADLELGFARLPGWVRLFLEDGADYRSRRSDVSDATVAIFAACALFAIPVRDGERRTFLMDWSTARKLPWDVVLLIGGGLALARGFQVSGLAEEAGRGIGPLLSGIPVWLVVALVALGVSLLTEVTSNAATTFVLLPVLGESAVAAELHPATLMMPATVAASLAFMLPVATPPNAVVFSSGRVSMASMARIGLLLNLIGVVLVTLVFELWVRRVSEIGAGVPEWAIP